jgi:DNA helicase-2/ATP-dependent DNA helicase PcrA
VQDSEYQRAKKAFRATATSYSAYGQSSYDQNYHGTSFRAAKSKHPTYTPVSNQRAFTTTNTAKASLDYGVGDRVRHIKFGDGEVMAVVEGGRDYEITVDFDKAGTKKMFASFAKLKKL